MPVATGMGGGSSDGTEALNAVLEQSKYGNLPWYKNPGVRYLNIVLILALISSANNGYDGMLMGGIQSLPLWKAYFPEFDDKSPSYNASMLGVMVSGQQIGGVIALPFCPIMAEKAGRRLAIGWGAAVALAGAILQGAATNITMYILARVLLGFGVAFLMNASPLLITELCYPTSRGAYTSSFNSLWHLGSLLANVTTYSTFFHTDDSSWRIPGYVQAVPNALQLALIWLVPESPRWMIAHGKEEQALQVLGKYHGGGDENDALVRFEFHEIKEALRIERETAGSVNMWSPFIGAGNRKRMMVIGAIAFFSQWSGNALFSYYQDQVYNTIGITDTKSKLTINIGQSVWQITISIFASLLVDRLGRRTLFLASNVGMLITYIIWTAINASYTPETISDSAGRGALAVWFFYNATYAIAYSPLLVAYTVEILPYRIRSLGLTWMNFFVNVSLVFNSYVNPVAFAALKWKYYIVYMVWLLVELIFVYFFVIETKGHTLEEIGVLFDGNAGDLAGAAGRNDEEFGKTNVTLPEKVAA
ncbi:hypothetical protein HDV00_006516 [Rhizophlyctis rosea]|nr:hypothetical protein HDV00_006516 [Rhizophlyctis rosea]